MNTLFINITRFGDLLQTQPAIAATEKQGRRSGLLCLEQFAPATALMRGVSYVQTVPTASLIAGVDRDWRAALGSQLSKGRSTVRQFPPSRLVGLTASLSARLLARQLALSTAAEHGTPPELLGFGLDDHGFGSSSSLWATFLLAATQKRGCSPFNIVDLFCKASGVPDGPWPNELAAPPDAARQQAQALLGAPPKGHVGFVGLQLGASDDRRRWPVALFAELGRLLATRLGLMPVLLGSKGEQPLAQRYLQQGAPGLDCTGRTDLQQLAAVLEACELLVSNDTGTMHLAAGLGRPVVGIFLATAQPWDTGPYAPGNICLEPDLPCHPCEFGSQCPHDLACRQRIGAATVCAAVEHIRGAALLPSSGNARIWRTELQEAGFMGLECLSHHEAEDRTQWVRLQRHIYRHFLDQRDVPPAGAAPLLSADLLREAGETLAAAAQLLELMQQQGTLLARMPREPVKKKFLGVWQRVQALFSQSPHFNVLSHLFAAESQEAGQDMASVLAFVQRYQGLVASWQALLAQA